MSYKKDLVDAAVKARNQAYSPYSSFCVGAALLCDDGTVYNGANIENASYGATICAERVAFSHALFEGKRDFKAIAIVGSKRGDRISSYCAPCGICRQFMAEFCREDFVILLFDGNNIKELALDSLLPEAFDRANL